MRSGMVRRASDIAGKTHSAERPRTAPEEEFLPAAPLAKSSVSAGRSRPPPRKCEYCVRHHIGQVLRIQGEDSNSSDLLKRFSVFRGCSTATRPQVSLQQIFAVGVTSASITCVACESVQPLASLRLFGLPMGYILSCPQRHATLIRGADTSARELARLPRCLNA
jgi:hypothetical protein